MAGNPAPMPRSVVSRRSGSRHTFMRPIEIPIPRIAMRRFITLSIVGVVACSSTQSRPGRPTTDDTYRVVDADHAVELLMSTTMLPSTVTVAFAIDRVWRVLPAVYDSLAIEVGTIDAATHVMGNEALQVRRRLGKVPLSQYITCGRNTPSGPMAGTYDIRLSVLSQLQPDGSGTKITTNVQATARPVGMPGTPVRCSSTGVLESRLVGAVKENAF